MTPQPANLDRLYDLLARRATVGLSPGEAAELGELLAKWPHVEDDAFDLAAAAVALAHVTPEPVPAALAARLLAAAPKSSPPPANWWKRAAVAGWATAAAVLVAFAASQLPRATPSAAARRDALRPIGATFASRPGDPAASIVWSQSKQEGYLEVRGLPANDPARSQYQLWIFDGGRGQPGQPDPNSRVDGGVFDVKPDGTALVPVRAALPVFRATAFAITEEPPGGVIVSRAADNLRAVLVP